MAAKVEKFASKALLKKHEKSEGKSQAKNEKKAGEKDVVSKKKSPSKKK